MNNSIFTIQPYKQGSVWVFDDPELGLHAEPFVGAVNQMIDAMLVRAGLIPSEPFVALFSDHPFPGTHMTLRWSHEEYGGHWYTENGTGGWLCPVLFKFFGEAPKFIYVRAEK